MISSPPTSQNRGKKRKENGKNQTLIRITELLPWKFQKKNQRKHWFFNLIFFMINKTTGFRLTLTNYLSTYLDAELMWAFITGFGLLQFWSVSSQHRYFGQSPFSPKNQSWQTDSYFTSPRVAGERPGGLRAGGLSIQVVFLSCVSQETWAKFNIRLFQ